LNTFGQCGFAFNFCIAKRTQNEPPRTFFALDTNITLAKRYCKALNDLTAYAVSLLESCFMVLSPSAPSVYQHLTDMLNELADLADNTEDPKLGDIAFRLRLIAMETDRNASPQTH
jgi:hypothetical protein